MDPELSKLVRKIFLRTKGKTELQTYQQLAASVGDAYDRWDATRVANLANRYECYFEKEGKYKIGVNWRAVLRDIEPDGTRKAKATVDSLRDAIDDEIAAFAKKNRNPPLRGRFLQRLKLDVVGIHYEVELLIEEDFSVPIAEGIEIELIWRQSRMAGTLLALDERRGTAIVELKQRPDEYQLRYEFGIALVVTALLRKIGERVKNYLQNPVGVFFNRLAANHAFCRPLDWYQPVYDDGLDESQRRAVRKCLESDMHFIWGPPGTGKTHTLARLIATLVMGGERVLVVSTANVAVDQVARQLVSTLKYIGGKGQTLLDKGRIIRFGRAVLPEIVQTPELFLNQPGVQRLRHDLEKIQARLKETSDPKERAELVSMYKQTLQTINDITKRYFDEAKVIATTSAQVFLKEDFEEVGYDTVIIDEAGMMPYAHLLALSTIPRKRLVIVGDFKQLAPVALGSTLDVQEWFRTDVFSKLGIKGTAEGKPVEKLNVQRRMHRAICELINQFNYEGNLKTESRPKEAILNLAPASNQPVVLVKTQGEVQLTQSGSRENPVNARIVVDLVTELAHTGLGNRASIGIITLTGRKWLSLSGILPTYAFRLLFGSRSKSEPYTLSRAMSLTSSCSTSLSRMPRISAGCLKAKAETAC